MSAAVNVINCRKCSGNTEFYCHTCDWDLCFSCKLKHIVGIDTSSHYVTLYREKFHALLKQERCVTHKDRAYDKFCTNCDLPVCFYYRKHRKHDLICMEMGYKNRRNEKKDIFIKMRSESLLNARALSVGIKNDIKSVLQKCYPSVYEFQIVMATKKTEIERFL